MRRWFSRLAGGRTPVEAARWVVIDCETSGLDPASDRLIAVGAVGVTAGRIGLADAFAGVLAQQAASDSSNILVHGIGGDEQLAGRPAASLLRELHAFVGDGIPVAFHAAFDIAVLRKAIARADAPDLPKRWLDLAALLPALFPVQGRSLRSLDDWLGISGIDALARHDALGDAFATAQLLLVALAQAERQGTRSVEAVLRTARQGRWLAPA